MLLWNLLLLPILTFAFFELNRDATLGRNCSKGVGARLDSMRPSSDPHIWSIYSRTTKLSVSSLTSRKNKDEKAGMDVFGLTKTLSSVLNKEEKLSLEGGALLNDRGDISRKVCLLQRKQRHLSECAQPEHLCICVCASRMLYVYTSFVCVLSHINGERIDWPVGRPAHFLF